MSIYHWIIVKLLPQSVRRSYEYSGGEFDADVTIVDPDLVLDQSSELMLSDYLIPPKPPVQIPPHSVAEERGDGEGVVGVGVRGGSGRRRIHHSTSNSTPPVPPPDVLSKRQLKLIGESCWR